MLLMAQEWCGRDCWGSGGMLQQDEVRQAVEMDVGNWNVQGLNYFQCPVATYRLIHKHGSIRLQGLHEVVCS